MNEPKIAGTQPKPVALSANETYHWCACARSHRESS
jgi:hypothetical protein